MIPDNRELASLILLGAASVWAISREDLRRCFAGVAEAFLKVQILLPFTAMIGYVALEVWLASKLSLWHVGLLKATVLWALVSGVALFLSFNEAAKETGFFWKTTKAAIGVAVFVEFYMNLFVFSLPGEVLLQLVLTPLVLLSVVAGMREEHPSVEKLLKGLLAIVGFAMLAFTTHQLWTNWAQLDKEHLLLEFALPVWLTIGFLPFIYLLGLYASYDSAFRGINWGAEDWRYRWRARIALLSKLHFRLREAHAFSWNWAKQLAKAPDFRTARDVVTDFLEQRRAAEREAIEEQAVLRRYVGSQETIEEGHRLDRREFKETMDALLWVHTCQMGWYRRNGEYRRDLLEILGSSFAQRGLPEDDPGIAMRVSDKGQAWYAWRRTVTGWCFAIGAADEPPDQWLYDGPEPPDGFPDKDPSWGSGPFSEEANPNWT